MQQNSGNIKENSGVISFTEENTGELTCCENNFFGMIAFVITTES